MSQPPIKVRLLSGTAERDGTELAVNQPYNFAGTMSKILTWRGCEIEVDGICDTEEVVPGGVKSGSTNGTAPSAAAASLSPMISYMNLHMLLASQRATAAVMPRGSPSATGPRLLVCGPPHTGRTSLVRTLAAWATKMAGFAGAASATPQQQQQQRMHQQPCVVNADPREGMLSLPGTLSAAVFATLMDLETEGGGGWGGAPSSGPSAVPVKLPLVYNYGYARPSDAPGLYRALVTRLAGSVAARLSEDAAVEASGLLIDTPAVTADDAADEASGLGSGLMSIDMLAHIIDEFSVNLVVVLGGEGSTDATAIRQALDVRFAGRPTTLGDPVQIVQLDASDGVVARSDSLEQQQREACIKEYFFGDAKRTLSPHTQQVDGDSLTIYRLPPADRHQLNMGDDNDAEKEEEEEDEYDPEAFSGEGSGGGGGGGGGSDGYGEDEGAIREHNLEPFGAAPALAHWTLAVMNAGVRDPPEVIQQAPVLGFVYVAEADGERRRVRILAPVSGRLGDRPLVFGRWPEPYINLVG